MTKQGDSKNKFVLVLEHKTKNQFFVCAFYCKINQHKQRFKHMWKK